MICAITKKGGKYHVLNAIMPGTIGSRLFVKTPMPDLIVEADTLEELPIEQWVNALDEECELRSKVKRKKRR